MTHEQPQQLPEAELIEIIPGQQALIVQLQARVAQLEEQTKRLTQPPKDASSPRALPSKRVKRGPKSGQPGRSRWRQPPDVIVECPPSRCRRYGADLSGAPPKLVGTSQVVEFARIEPLVIEARRYQVTCLARAQRQVAQYPPGLEP